MKRILLLIVLIGISVALQAQFFKQVNSFLIQNVEKGRIDYKTLKTQPSILNDLIDQISSYQLEDKTEDHRLAFYINAYNLLVIKQVMEKYPIASPLKVDGFFKVEKFQVAGETLTLDEIEFGKLTDVYKDPRIHFTLGCGALSCPFLYDNVYNPEHIEEQMQFRTELILDRPNYVDVVKEEKRVYVNKIFDWYQDQFIAQSGSVLNFINEYRFYKVPLDYEVMFIEYDWTLNDLKEE